MSGFLIFSFSLLDKVPRNVDMELIPRGAQNSVIILGLIVFCAIALSLARVRQREAYFIAFQHIFLFTSSETQQKNGLRMNPASSVFLSLQYILISIACLYWISVLKIETAHWSQFLLLLLFPAIYAFYQLFILWFSARISGSASIIDNLWYTTITTYQIAGIVLFIEFFFFYFQPGLISGAKWILFGTFSFFLIQRFLRCFFIALRENVSWYHIILYFWTLEILPLLVLMKLFIGNNWGFLEK
jgi:hypothetical protein